MGICDICDKRGVITFPIPHNPTLRGKWLWSLKKGGYRGNFPSKQLMYICMNHFPEGHDPSDQTVLPMIVFMPGAHSRQKWGRRDGIKEELGSDADESDALPMPSKRLLPKFQSADDGWMLPSRR